jgi:hypothetical protein
MTYDQELSLGLTIRAQWPHSIEDIEKSLDGIWGLVGATSAGGDLYRLERSLSEPYVFTVTEYNGVDEADIKSKQTFEAVKRSEAIALFARAIGFDV